MLSLFPRDVLDEIWDLIESVSEGFHTYSFVFTIYPEQMFRMLLNFEARTEGSKKLHPYSLQEES